MGRAKGRGGGAAAVRPCRSTTAEVLRQGGCADTSLATHSLTRAQVMRGDRVMNSAYEIKMHIEESCNFVVDAFSGIQA